MNVAALDQRQDTFCALPFEHLCVGPEGTARICCVAHELVSEHGAPMSLNVHSMDELWNSAYMRKVRRAMIKGERVSACEVCYESEAKSGQSYRTHTGVRPIEERMMRSMLNTINTEMARM